MTGCVTSTVFVQSWKVCNSFENGKIVLPDLVVWNIIAGSRKSLDFLSSTHIKYEKTRFDQV